MGRRRVILVALAVLALVVLAGYTAHAQGALLYRGADLRLDARLDPEGMREVEQVWRFQIPAGTTHLAIRQHISNEGEASLAFGTGPHSLMRHTFLTPRPWEAPDMLGGGVVSSTQVRPGPYEIHVSAKEPARFVLGVYFLDEPYEGARS